MSGFFVFQTKFNRKFKTDSFCASGCQKWGILGTESERFRTGRNSFVWRCFTYERRKSIDVRNDAIKAQGLSHFSET